MCYTSDLSEKEWEIIEPSITAEEKDKTSVMDKARNIKRHILLTEARM
jgi:hypothetical protein